MAARTIAVIILAATLLIAGVTAAVLRDRAADRDADRRQASLEQMLCDSGHPDARFLDCR